jgi:putative FmdB family regulatory protein
MPTYLYECPICGEFEHEHSITEQLETCPRCAVLQTHIAIPKVKRLIASGGSFILSGSGWAKDRYS